MIRRFLKFIFTILLFALGIFAIAFIMLVGRNYKARGEARDAVIVKTTDRIKDSLSDSIDKIDPQTVTKAMDYLKEKSDNGELKTADDVRDAVKDGARNLGVEVSDETADQIKDAVDSLENLGFSTETLMNETQKVYQKYGEEFLDHMEEAFIEASKDAAGNMAQEIWDSVEDTIRETF